MSPSATVSDLGQKVKAKYPGQYDDLPDDEVGRRVKAKHPGAYDDFADNSVPGMEKLGGTNPPPPAAPKPNELKPPDQQDNSFWTSPQGLIRSGMRQAVHGVEAGSAPGLDPKLGAASEVIRGLGKAALPAAIPLAAANPATAVGALAGGALGSTAAGSTARALNAPPGVQALSEDVGGIVGGGVGARAGSQVPGVVRGAFKLNPDIAAEKIWRPTPADSDFPQVTPAAVSDVKTYGNPLVKTNADTKPAAQAAIKALQSGLDAWLDRARTTGINQIPGDELVKAAQGAIPDLMWTRDPQGAQAIVDQAQQAFGGKQFTTDQFRSWLKTENADLSSFYNRSEAAQRAGVGSGTPPAIEKAQVQKIRELLYNKLDPENQGAGPREIQQRTGAVYTLMNAADRRANSILAEKAVSPAEKMGRVAAGILNIPGKVFHGDVEGAVGAFQHPGEGTSDPLVARLFQDTPSAAPIPKPPGIVRNLNPRRALPAPSIVTPPPPDQSFVRSAPAMTQPPNPARALPPASTIQVPPSPLTRPTGETIPAQTGVPGADKSFVRGVPAHSVPTTIAQRLAQSILNGGGQ